MGESLKLEVEKGSLEKGEMGRYACSEANVGHKTKAENEYPAQKMDSAGPPRLLEDISNEKRPIQVHTVFFHLRMSRKYAAVIALTARRRSSAIKTGLLTASQHSCHTNEAFLSPA